MQMVMGNIHIHSTYSDGAAGIPEIARLAAKSGLDYIIITDHNTLRGLPEEGFYENVLVLCGSEINIEKNHYFALGISREVAANDDNPQEVINAVKEQGGLGFIAHPFDKGSPVVEDGRSYPWEDWQAKDFTGIEVWNWGSQWRDAIKNKPMALYFAYLKQEAPITGPYPEAMAFFDRISKQRKITAIAGTDAHDFHIRRGPLQRRIFPYEYLFHTVNNCLFLPQPLSGDFEKAKEQVLTALRLGRAFIVNRRAGEPDGFSFTVSSGKRTAIPGEEIEFKEQKTILRVRCLGRSRKKVFLKIIRNGELYWEKRDNKVEGLLGKKGIYRVEAYLNRKPWIFTNPIYVV